MLYEVITSSESPAFVLDLWDRDAADLAGIGNVRTAVGLAVEADNVDHPYLIDEFREQVHLRADEARA